MIKINLAPSDRRHRRGTGVRAVRLPQLPMPDVKLGIAFGAIAVVAIAGSGAWWWQLRAHEAQLTSELQQATTELQTLKTRIGQASRIKEQVAELQKRVDTIQGLTKSQTRQVALFDAMADVVPRNLWLTGVDERGITIRLSGAATSAAAVSELMSNLRMSGRFKDVDIVVSRQDLSKTPRVVTFEVTCRFES